MRVRYDHLNMMRNRVGSDGVSPEELQVLAGPLVRGREALKARHQDGSLGFFGVPEARPSLKAMEALLENLDSDIETLVVIGIGGSLLGAQALHAALGGLKKLGRTRKPLRLVFAGDATDPQAIADLLASVDWKKAAINIISKSGDTIEPMAVFVLARKALIDAVGKKAAARRVIATTDPSKGTLRKIADREGYATLPVPGNVGGRFSVFTEVGMFPALAGGLDVRGMWKGAAEATAHFWKEPGVKNAPLKFAGLQYLEYKKGKPITVLMPYAQRLRLVGDWFSQLWAESLGKKTDRTRSTVHVGPTPVSAVGPADQHSQIQLYNEGPNDKIVTFVEVERYAVDQRLPDPWPTIEGTAYFGGHPMSEIVHYERQATAEALTMNRRPNGTLIIDDLSAESLGALMQTLMCATAATGELFNIDAFDQPGVEAGKKEMYKLMGREGY
jgi:glucose-6-phosphate isomerase